MSNFQATRNIEDLYDEREDVPMGQRHDWILCGAWGVVFGLSTCRRCGAQATEERLEEFCHADPS